MSKKIHFYFDFMSPYSYFAWQSLRGFCDSHDLEISLKPVLLGKLLNEWGIKGPGEVEPKREFMLKTCLRYAKRMNIPFITPKTHPFNPLYALRMAVSKNASKEQWGVIDTIWKAGWQKRLDLGDPDILIRELNEAGFDGQKLYDQSFEREIKLELKANIKEAISFGAFGVPTFVMPEENNNAGELFWGNDSYNDLSMYLKNEDPLDRELLQMLLDSTPRAAAQSL
jgi:2-hydroxychromene-2-carboxylate isomerase